MWTLLSTSFIFHIFRTNEIYGKVSFFSAAQFHRGERRQTPKKFIVNFRCIKYLKWTSIVLCTSASLKPRRNYKFPLKWWEFLSTVFCVPYSLTRNLLLQQLFLCSLFFPIPGCYFKKGKMKNDLNFPSPSLAKNISIDSLHVLIG